MACSFSIVVFFFDESGDISGLKQTMKLNLHVYNGSASLQGIQQGVYVILLTKYRMISSLVLLSSFIPTSHVTVTQYIPIYFIITTFVPSVPLGLHGLCFAHELLRQLHNQSHENPKRTRLGHVFAVPPFSHGSMWNFFFALISSCKGKQCPLIFFQLSVVNTSILS